MKQILIVGSGHHFPEGPFGFLRSMQEFERVHARALFFLPVDYSVLAAAASGADLTPILELEDNEKEWITTHKMLFARQCERQFISHSEHDHDEQWSRDVLVKESRFADLILVSADFPYLREALHDAECPVMVVPENFSVPEHLFMAYDGGRESLYAIKQFCYLFPGLTDLPTEILYVRDDVTDNIPDLASLQEFSRLKFNSMSFSKLHFPAREYFATWISEKKHVLLASGSYGRSAVSYLGKRSFVEDIIHARQLPVFIAHP
jgi:hypothetical protein